MSSYSQDLKAKWVDLNRSIEKSEEELQVKKLKIVITDVFINYTDDEKEKDFINLYNNVLKAINDFYKLEK